ncbi:hypothetical protein L9W76_18535 [Vibrio aestuarianus]|uniref:hypothetical protein n=1 Tax=Vibrio aestuarianus TaxID=28171 RepID=UPI00237C8ACD|nr:hypothetical protein [Vibrio aestuarianus]MDE1255117.1 hypothetical protein [Vibrio aestuarianus]
MRLKTGFLMLLLSLNMAVSAHEMDGKKVIKLEGCQEIFTHIEDISFTIMNTAVIQEQTFGNGQLSTSKYDIDGTWVVDETYLLFTSWSENAELSTKRTMTIEYSDNTLKIYSAVFIGEHMENLRLMNATSSFYHCNHKS